MYEKIPDILGIYNKISKVLMEELGTRLVSIESSMAMSECTRQLCELYAGLPKVRKRKAINHAQKQAMANIMKAVDHA